LRDIKAKVYTESVPDGLPFDCSAQSLARARVWHFVTTAGRVDVAFEPSGTTGYDDLIRSAVAFTAFGVEVQAASLEDILRSKQAADRPQDRQDVVVLREMLRKRQR
jgi:hypothetical protein